MPQGFFRHRRSPKVDKPYVRAEPPDFARRESPVVVLDRLMVA
ncbi:hypothetical protein [Altericista sp. CCNU0014]